MFKLPISELTVTMRQPTGREDLLLQEFHGSDLAAAVNLMDHLAVTTAGERLPWERLTVTDLEVLMLWLRRSMLGNTVRAVTSCVQAECGARVDVTFGIGEYVESQQSRIPGGIAKEEEAGWFNVVEEGVRFRLPSCGDILGLKASGEGQKAQQRLLQKCVEQTETSSRLYRRIERAMRVIAAPLSGNMAGICPECGKKLTLYFDVIAFVLREMRDQAASLFQDIHLLALHYKWPEEKILGLPRNRRLLYAEMIRGDRIVA